MGLSSALAIASSGLGNIDAQFALLSENVANASTPGYAVEVSSQQNVTAEGIGLGVHVGPATLQIDQTLQASLTQQNSTVAGLQTTQASLQLIDNVLGTPGSGSDLTSLLGNLQNSFSTLLTDPSNQGQQSAVVAAASTLAQGINALSTAYAAQRQAAQTDLQSAVTTLNTTLTTIGQLNQQIIALKSGGQSTADLENQRDAAVQTLSGLVQVKTVAQPNGNLMISSPSGLSLPTDAGADTFSISPATTGAGSYYPGGGLPGVMLSGSDVTSQMSGGEIGADLALRDQILPTSQAELDELSYGLADRFATQGLSLFTDPVGNVPTGGGSPTQAGYIGFSSVIQVNPAITATPSLVRDGTNTATGFTPNPSGGPAGFTTLISRVVSYAFGNQAQAGVPQPTMATTGLGASGTLTAPFAASNVSLANYATNLIDAQSQQSAAVTASLATEQALQTGLNTKWTAISGVKMDTEMSQMLTLQNAYSVNARVISAIQTMFNQLLETVQ